MSLTLFLHPQPSSSHPSYVFLFIFLWAFLGLAVRGVWQAWRGKQVARGLAQAISALFVVLSALYVYRERITMLSTTVRVVSLLIMVSWAVLANMAVINLRHRQLDPIVRILWKIVILIPIVGALVVLVINPGEPQSGGEQ